MSYRCRLRQHILSANKITLMNFSRQANASPLKKKKKNSNKKKTFMMTRDYQ